MLRNFRIMLVGLLAFSFLSVPVASQAILPAPTVTVSTTHPNYNDQVTLTATGLTPGQPYSFAAVLPAEGFLQGGPFQLDEGVVADDTGTAVDTVSWNSGVACKLAESSFSCFFAEYALSIFRSQVVVLDIDNQIYATSDYVYAGRGNKPGNVILSGAGYQNGKFVPGETLHISASNVGGAANGSFTIVAVQSMGTTTEDFWETVFSPQLNSYTIAEVDLVAGAAEEDVTVPNDLSPDALQIQMYWFGGDNNLLTEAGISVVLESAAGGTPPVSNNFINSITQAKAWAKVDFTLPTLATGKYDRVAYSVNGGSWVSWGLNAKSVQSIKGLRTGREYSIRIRGHVKRGAWTVASEPVTIFMKKISKGVVVQ